MSDADRTPKLYHFTCKHSARVLGHDRCQLRPNRHVLLGVELVWLTTQPRPDRVKTGLTMDTIMCDRMQFRYRVTGGAVEPWIESTIRRSVMPKSMTSAQIDEFESDRDPEHWWISTDLVPARFDWTWNPSRPIWAVP